MNHQNDDGSWSFHAFHTRCGGRCQDVGSVKNDVAATSLAILAYLGYGQTEQQGHFKRAVRDGSTWLVNRQNVNGDFRGADPSLSMDSHAMATLVVCSAYGLTRQRDLRGAAQRGIDFICSTQRADGGWSKSAKDESDLFTSTWHLMALRAGHLAGLKVPPSASENVKTFLDTCQADPTGTRYRAKAGDLPSREATAMALLCRQLTGWRRGEKALQDACSSLLEQFAGDTNPEMLMAFIATQVFHKVEGKPWETWNEKHVHALARLVGREGHERGSWKPTCEQDEKYGRLYATAMAVCTLSIYYRHLPIHSARAVDAE